MAWRDGGGGGGYALYFREMYGTKLYYNMPMIPNLDFVL